MQNGKFSLLVLKPPAALGTKNEELSCEATLQRLLFLYRLFFLLCWQVLCYGLGREGQRGASRPSLEWWCLAGIISGVSDYFWVVS